MFILLHKEGPYIFKYVNDTLTEFDEYEKYKHLGLVYPYMCIFVDNVKLTTPAILMLSYDSKMRLQYKYNQAHIEKSINDKVIYVKLMINNLNKAIEQINIDINSNDEMTQLLALMALLTFQTGIRIGKDAHLKSYNSIGLSTLMKRHIKCTSNSCIFNFIGKKGVEYTYKITDIQCVKILKSQILKCNNNNDFIFHTSTRKITYTDFNDYVKLLFNDSRVAGKDFRTLLANVSFVDHFKSLSTIQSSPNEIKNNIKESIKYVANVLQNTNAVSKKSYIFNTIIEYINDNYINFIKTKDTIQLLKIIFKSF